MTNNPDIYLLYEYMEKVPFTVRMKVCLDVPVDAEILTDAAQEAISRLPYFSVKVGLDAGQNYTLEHNDKPVAVLPEKDDVIYKSARNIAGVKVALINTLNVYDILNCDKLLVLKDAVSKIEEVYA